jgi:hypothetical protein
MKPRDDGAFNNSSLVDSHVRRPLEGGALYRFAACSILQMELALQRYLHT